MFERNALPAGVTRDAVGCYELPDELPFEDVRGLLLEEARNHSRSMWAVASLIAHCERVHGTRYDEAIAMTELSYRTLKNAVWVYRAVERSRRRDLLSFSHHAAVAGLPPDHQDRLLSAAVDGHWTRAKLRDEAYKTHAELHLTFREEVTVTVETPFPEPVVAPVRSAVRNEVPPRSTEIHPFPARHLRPEPRRENLSAPQPDTIELSPSRPVEKDDSTSDESYEEIGRQLQRELIGKYGYDGARQVWLHAEPPRVH